MEIVGDSKKRGSSLEEEVGSSERQKFVPLSGTLSSDIIDFWSNYYNGRVGQRKSYGPSGDLHLDDDTSIFLPVLRENNKEKLNVIAFIDDKGIINELRINLKDTNRFLQMRGNALVDTHEYHLKMVEERNHS